VFSAVCVFFLCVSTTAVFVWDTSAKEWTCSASRNRVVDPCVLAQPKGITKKCRQHSWTAKMGWSCIGACAAPSQRWRDCLGAALSFDAFNHQAGASPLKSCADITGNTNHVQDAGQEASKDCSTASVTCAVWIRRCTCSSAAESDCIVADGSALQESWTFQAFVDNTEITSATQAANVTSKIAETYAEWQANRTSTVLADENLLGASSSSSSSISSSARADWSVPQGLVLVDASSETVLDPASGTQKTIFDYIKSSVVTAFETRGLKNKDCTKSAVTVTDFSPFGVNTTSVADEHGAGYDKIGVVDLRVRLERVEDALGETMQLGGRCQFEEEKYAIVQLAKLPHGRAVPSHGKIVIGRIARKPGSDGECTKADITKFDAAMREGVAKFRFELAKEITHIYSTGKFHSMTKVTVLMRRLFD